MNKPVPLICLFAYTSLWTEGKNPKEFYFTELQILSSVGDVNIQAKGDVLHVTSNIFSTFFHTQEGRSAIHDALLPHILRCSQQFQHTGTHSIILWPDWQESSPVLWLHFHCFPCCFMLDSTHLERKDWRNRAFAFHHMPAANGCYHTMSPFCKLIFKPKSYRNLVGPGESPWPCQERLSVVNRHW